MHVKHQEGSDDDLDTTFSPSSYSRNANKSSPYSSSRHQIAEKADDINIVNEDIVDLAASIYNNKFKLTKQQHTPIPLSASLSSRLSPDNNLLQEFKDTMHKRNGNKSHSGKSVLDDSEIEDQGEFSEDESKESTTSSNSSSSSCSSSSDAGSTIPISTSALQESSTSPTAALFEATQHPQRQDSSSQSRRAKNDAVTKISKVQHLEKVSAVDKSSKPTTAATRGKRTAASNSKSNFKSLLLTL